ELERRVPAVVRAPRAGGRSGERATADLSVVTVGGVVARHGRAAELDGAAGHRRQTARGNRRRPDAAVVASRRSTENAVGAGAEDDARRGVAHRWRTR